MIEEKIGNDEKGADMKLWSKNKALGDVSRNSLIRVCIVNG